MKANVNLSFRVNVQATVMKGDKVVRKYPMEHNLVLDSGLERLSVTYTSDTFVTAALGNGTTPTERTSVGWITVSATGGTATATAGFFEEGDVGKAMKFTSTGQVAKITGFTSTTIVTISITDVIATQVVTVYNTDQTQLASYVVGSETYLDTGNGENGSSDVINDGVDWVIKRWRTFQFPAETGDVTYTEGGWTWEEVAVANPTLFGRILFSTAVNLAAGEFLLMYVELRTTIDCTVKTIGALPITNLAVAAKSTVRPRATYNYYDEVTSAGASDHSNINVEKGGVSEPLNHKFNPASYPAQPAAQVLLTNDSTAITSDPVDASGVTEASISVPPEDYVPNSYQFVFVAFFTGVSVDLTGDWYDIRFSNSGADGRSCFRILFDSVQSKTATDTVQLVFTKSWTRDLS
jgi:hypothetical protein